MEDGPQPSASVCIARNGLRCVRVLLHDTEIDSLVRQGYLKQERRHLPAAVEDALGDFICHRLGRPEEPAEEHN